jgi:hypothetical protein
MSALPLRADMLSLGIYVCLVPKADLALCESFRQPLRAYGARSW